MDRKDSMVRRALTGLRDQAVRQEPLVQRALMASMDRPALRAQQVLMVRQEPPELPVIPALTVPPEPRERPVLMVRKD